jgi:hypothetical protein
MTTVRSTNEFGVPESRSFLFAHLFIKHRNLRDILYHRECLNKLHRSLTQFQTQNAGKQLHSFPFLLLLKTAIFFFTNTPTNRVDFAVISKKLSWFVSLLK